MLYVPSLFSENLMDDWMDDFESEFFGRKNPLYGKHAKNMMKTDVKETENGYEVAVDPLEVREHLLERVRVDAPARHVLGPGEDAALDDEHALAGRRRRVGRHGAGAAAAHDDDVEIGLGHLGSFLV